MPSSQVKDFIKNFNLDKVFAVRLSRRCPAKNGRTQHSSTTTHHDVHLDSLSRDPGHEISINISAATSSRGDSSARKASDMAQTFLPLVQSVAGAIPLAGPPMQAAISGLLSILQVVDRRSQNKADIDRLALRLHRLSSHMCNAPTAQDPYEQYRRDSIIGILQETSAQLTRLQKRRLEYASITQAIAGCSTEINNYLLESLWLFQMQQSQTARGPPVTQLTAAVTLGCVTLVDATGHEHAISVTFCASFQQLNEMLQVLFKRDSIEAQIQRRYMEQGQYDLCIDDDKQVTRLTNHEWPSIEAGTTIVMRVVFEEETCSTVQYKCHFCRAVNHISDKYSPQRRASCSINCRECKQRFQISRENYSAKRSTQSSNIDSVSRTEAEVHLIRNFRIQQTVRYHETSLAVLN
ncbi:uncharacterized protein BJ212DRAFT_497630 [Suillus subaureus]|uniref:Ubiquitin-like domain-containing protein n=1 Tax=Suillus subaureus TaxID=48587 RepID=A0A9P7JB00_9AGAM|nr:uncharacterized protein BJ212DRAFT_497630 [Suillus subaureus]KAG1811864.1 hypothetical protein BJ212DRAFT_497630 [Suillus subaureus]